MSAKVAVVIPNHKENLSDLEKISLDRCRKVLGRYPLIHVVPDGKNFSYFAAGEMVAHFPAQYFQTLRGYNQLSISPIFYEPFSDFDYMLIYQLDAFVFYDALEEFCSLGYDYIGAPWPYFVWNSSREPKTPRVGNGGFCLRKVSACHKLLTTASHSPNWANTLATCDEDTFFSSCGVTEELNFHVAPVEVAKLFSMEWYPDRHVRKLGGLPFGCHNWIKFAADFYVETFRHFGYDLRPFRSQMGTVDCREKTAIHLTDVAIERLLRRIERGLSIADFLPTKNFSSVRVIRSPKAMKILAQLLTEENSLADKIFVYDEKVWTNLLRDVTRENLPHLIVVADYDASLVKAVERQGLRYGEDFISFQREYMKYCEEIFRRLVSSVRNEELGVNFTSPKL